MAAELLRNLRGSRSLSEVAACIGISTAALAAYERGERTPRDEIKSRLEAFYGTAIYSNPNLEMRGFYFKGKQRHVIAGGEISPFERIVIGDLRCADSETRQAVFKLLGIDGEEVVV